MEKTTTNGVGVRLARLGALVAVLFALLVGRLWQLQILQGPRYLRLSEENRLRDLRLLAPHGTIFDRRGRPLVSNRAAFTVAILPTEVRNPDGTVPLLAQILAVPEAEIRERLRQGRTRAFEPVRLRRDVPKRIVATLEENRLDLPGVMIEAEAVRHYPYGMLAAHALGYVGEISEAELVTRAWTGYRMGDLIGKAGVERVYDRILRGRDGKMRVEVDALGRQLRVLRREPGEAGRSIVLTIDLDIQRAAEAALGDRTGAVVALDVRSGEVLALASHPAFDPNAFAGGISERAWTRLARDPARPLLNRAVDSAYEPGSAFKIVTGTAALMRGTATRTTRIYDPGYLRLGGWVYRGLKAYGTVDFLTGLAVSSNVYFWTLGLRTGPDALSETAHALGLGERTGIDLPSETSGSIPSPPWKQRRLGEPWYPGDTVNMATGQGWVNTTAVQMARLVAAIGNGGTVVQPHLLRSVLDAEGRPVERKPVEPVARVSFDSGTLQTLHDALEAVVLRGTGRGARIPGVRIAGKTGSAENPRGEPHAWFVAYAPAENPIIALAVVVEHGKRGGVAAVPIAKAVLQAFFETPRAEP